MNDGQESLGNLHVAAFRNGGMKIASLDKYRVTAPVVGDDGGAWRNDALDEASQRFSASVGYHRESNTSGVPSSLPLVEAATVLALFNLDGIGNAVPTAPPASAGGAHAGHGNPGGAAPTFAAAYANAVANTAPAASAAGHAHGARPPASVGSSASGSNTHGSQGASSGTDPRFIPLTDQQQGENHDFQEMVLGVRAYRQQLIASNIANADTPGYKAVDIDFQEALRIARSVANTPPLSLATTASGHIQGMTQSSLASYPLKYHVLLQPSADGNTVEMDVERAKFAENAVMWEFSRDRVSGHFKHMMEMLQNLKD